MKDLYRLVYTSFRKPSCDEEAIQNILQACKRNNPHRGVTGILLHSKNRFIQYMEGEKEQVEALYDLIKDDPRHTSVNRRSFESIDNRVFPSWEMGYKDLAEETLSFDTNIESSDKSKFEELIGGEIDFGNEGMRLLQLFFKA